MRNALECPGNRADQVEERISKMEDRNREMFQMEGRREDLRSEETLQELADSIRKANIRIMNFLEGEARGKRTNSTLKEITLENLQNLGKRTGYTKSVKPRAHLIISMQDFLQDTLY